MKKLLKEWKKLLYESADRERLAKLAQLGDEEAAAQLNTQDARRSTLSNKEIAKRILDNYGVDRHVYKELESRGNPFEITISMDYKGKILRLNIDISTNDEWRWTLFELSNMQDARNPQGRAWWEVVERDNGPSQSWQEAVEEVMQKLQTEE